MHASTMKRIKIARELTLKYYEPGNQTKCYRAVWRNHIQKIMGISYRTYLNYIGTPVTDM